MEKVNDTDPFNPVIEQTRKLGCFVAGPLVHTREGLKPIEQIKVGDYVLSKPESGEGELCYQPVTLTYQYEDRELYFVAWEARKEQTEGEKPAWDYDCMAVTGGHPIWVKQMTFCHGRGSEYVEEERDINAWMTVEELYRKVWNAHFSYDPDNGYWFTPIYAELADGRVAIIKTIEQILQSEDPNIGVSFEYVDWSECVGKALRFGDGGVRDCYIDKSVPRHIFLGEVVERNYDYTGYDITSEMSVVVRSGGHLPMRRCVYNLEVANTHTYFVGNPGLWVHNEH